MVDKVLAIKQALLIADSNSVVKLLGEDDTSIPSSFKVEVYTKIISNPMDIMSMIVIAIEDDLDAYIELVKPAFTTAVGFCETLMPEMNKAFGIDSEEELLSDKVNCVIGSIYSSLLRKYYPDMNDEERWDKLSQLNMSLLGVPENSQIRDKIANNTMDIMKDLFKS